MKFLPSYYLLAARALTLARLAAIPVFIFFLVQTDREGAQVWGTTLLLLYLFAVLSDFFDGLLARKAEATSRFWGYMDATADVLFNTVSLSAAAWLGRVGFWVPAGVAILGGRFILRNSGRRPLLKEQMVEDLAGKTAGVLFYLLVGAVALELSVEGEAGRWLVARAGDAVFLYTLFVLLRKRSP